MNAYSVLWAGQPACRLVVVSSSVDVHAYSDHWAHRARRDLHRCRQDGAMRFRQTCRLKHSRSRSQAAALPGPQAVEVVARLLHRRVGLAERTAESPCTFVA